jgi:dsDNA-specific endonuclease/ATPase MutS2
VQVRNDADLPGQAALSLRTIHKLALPDSVLTATSDDAPETASERRFSGAGEAGEHPPVRGLRADEAIGRLVPALDAAYQADLRSFRIIHGKGTGALRELVAEQLRDDGRIKTFRAGGMGEGGTGVTVVEFA